MFRAEAVYDAKDLLFLGREDQIRVVLEHRRYHFTARQCLRIESSNTLRARLEQRPRLRYQRDAGKRIVLCLSQKFVYDELGIRGVVRDDEQLRRARETVDRTGAVHLPLRFRHPHVARADDFVDARNRFGTVRSRRDRLRAADRVQFVYVAQPAGEQHGRRNFSVPLRRRQDDRPRDPGYLCRHHTHDHRRRQRGAAARDVGSDRIERMIAQRALRAVFIGEFDVAAQLPAMKLLDPFARKRERLHDFMRYERTRALVHRNRYAKFADVVHPVVETARELDQCAVTSPAHLRDDLRNARAELRRPFPAAAKQRRECLPVRGIHDRDVHPPPFIRSINARSRAYLARKRTGLITSRAVDEAISSTTTMSCSRSVFPVATKSTMTSERPTSGLSSTEPCKAMISHGRSRSAKYACAERLNFVATRKNVGYRAPSWYPSLRRAATTRRQAP